tara:strand:+ start:69 stop:851 length:783 start_codon:yes stop_codon:yes gene_type:complete
VPQSQNLGRVLIKESNIDFLPKLISEKKFINVVKNLTIFVEEYEKNGELSKIYINEKIDSNKSKIIISESGKIIKKNNKYILRLYDGGITNINKDNTYALNFSETDYDLSNFSTKTVTRSKIQEIDTFKLFDCVKGFFPKKDFDEKETISNIEKKSCHTRTIKSIVEELYKRIILPFYTLVIALISSSLIIEPKRSILSKFHKLNIFLIGTSIIILSQISLKYFFISQSMSYFIILLPIILVIIYYLFLNIFTKFKLNLL